jgi:SAM-dependent methyltransferase
LLLLSPSAIMDRSAVRSVTDVPESSHRRPRETYSQRENPAFEAWIAKRSAEKEAAFLIPYLRPGMRVLDVGCGPGSITAGLADIVAPGTVIGIDRQNTQVESALALAIERRKLNLRVLAADSYQLPFAANSFDAVFAHAVLMHLSDPVRALAEVRRVLRPEGIVGVRDIDFGSVLLSPETPLLSETLALRARVRQHNGSDPFIGRRHRSLLLKAGFVSAEASASLESAGSLDETRKMGEWLKLQIEGLARTAIAERWITQRRLNEMLAELDAWAQRPDAFYAVTYCAAIGRAGV